MEFLARCLNFKLWFRKLWRLHVQPNTLQTACRLDLKTKERKWDRRLERRIGRF